MTSFVVDASVAAKWFLPAAGEPLTEQALELLRGYAEGRFRLMVPDLFWAEMGNILWKASRRGRMTAAEAEKALEAMLGRNLPTTASKGLLRVAFAIAAEFDRGVYDSLYVALAISSKAQLITADEKLWRALPAHLPVKWLGAM